MTDGAVAERLRRFMLVVAAFAGAAAIVELWLESHTGDVIQLLAFAFAGLAVVSATAALVRPARRVLLAHRVLMVVVVAGSGFGIYEHVEHNIEFALDIRPTATLADVWFEGLTGASPPLAPGVLGLAAVLAIGGTYRHPALVQGPPDA